MHGYHIAMLMVARHQCSSSLSPPAAVLSLNSSLERPRGTNSPLRLILRENDRARLKAASNGRPSSMYCLSTCTRSELWSRYSDVTLPARSALPVLPMRWMKSIALGAKSACSTISSQVPQASRLVTQFMGHPPGRQVLHPECLGLWLLNQCRP